jgi:tight adherence protein C
MDAAQSFLPMLADLRWLVIAVAGLAVAGLAFGLGSLLSSAGDPVRRRLGLDAGGPAASDPAAARFAAAMAPLAKYFAPRSESEQQTVADRLRHAGFRAPYAASAFHALKGVLALGLPLVAFLGTRLFPTLTGDEIVYLCAGAGAFGLLLPSYVLDKLVMRRQRDLRNAFPDALDLLVVCVESGLGLGAAIQRVSQELEVSHPELAGELEIVNAEMRAGVDREAALRNLADRTGLDDIRGLVGLLVQTLRFGTGVADALRVYSEEFRDRRRQKAEEQAAKVATKMIFPLILCLFPGFFVVAIGPAVMMIIEGFRQVGGN